MKKVVAAFDGLRYSESTQEYAIRIAKLGATHLVGVFLNDLTYHSYKIYDLIRKEGKQFEARQKKLEKLDAGKRVKAIAGFERACREAGLNYGVHADRGIAIQELLHESIYADLLVFASDETFSHHVDKVPTHFVRDLLSNVQCPVLLVPHKYKPIDRLMFLYDGEPSSVYAIKMFSYILSSFGDIPVEILSVKPLKQSLHLPDNRLMKEFMKRHFPGASYTVLKGFAETEIVNYLKEKKGVPLVVLGAYQRSMVSRWFRASMADVLIKDLKLPLFIAHNK